ncbi:MAG: CCA tRNA nucleotidyltransferase [Anaerolineae bacterium]|nr:CCA tRNA nucleotidyltransferase [Anaerolineae bacterium]
MFKERIERWLRQEPLRWAVIEYLCTLSCPLYLVGGAVRDALLGRPGCDVDLAVKGRAIALARQIADRFHGAYVPLDLERDTARVVFVLEGRRQYVDLAKLRAESIEEDLQARDFTVNAMAVPLLEGGVGELIDPTGGQRDLSRRLLRVVYPQAFAEDPLRVLRAVRLQGSLGFVLTDDTMELARRWAWALSKVSAERIRDELVQILSLREASEAFQCAFELGALRVVFPELASSELAADAIATLRELEKVLAGFEEGGGPFPQLRPYRGALLMHWNDEFSPGQKGRLLLKLAALLVPVFWNEPRGAARVARRLRFSSQQVCYLERILQGVRLLLEGSVLREPLGAYRYFRQVGKAGLDGAILFLVLQDQARQKAHLDVVQFLLEAWFRRYDRLVAPPRLLSGREVMEVLGLKPGPDVGKWLERLQEAQVKGQVRSREEAIVFLRRCKGGYVRKRDKRA